MSVRRYSKRTIRSYVYWIRYFIVFNKMRHPRDMGAPEVRRFLTHLSVSRQVAVSTQKNALNALAFLYYRVFEQPFGDLGEFNRSRRTPKLPVVLNRAEVARLLQCMTGTSHLFASLLYGSGLRLAEAMRLRIKDIDFDHHQLQVWNGKGGYHRLTTLAPELTPSLQVQAERVRMQLMQDSMQGSGCQTRWRANIQTPARRSVGNIFSRRRDWRLTLNRACCGVIKVRSSL